MAKQRTIGSLPLPLLHPIKLLCLRRKHSSAPKNSYEPHFLPHLPFIEDPNAASKHDLDMWLKFLVLPASTTALSDFLRTKPSDKFFENTVVARFRENLPSIHADFRFFSRQVTPATIHLDPLLWRYQLVRQPWAPYLQRMEQGFGQVHLR